MSSAKRTRYPLGAAIKVRLMARDEAVGLLAERQRLLVEEEEKLRRLEMRREVLNQERSSASDQLFDTDDGLIDVAEIDRRRGAIQFLDQRLEDCAHQIEEQESSAWLAQERVDQARQELVVASQELEVLEKHRAEWEKQRRKEEQGREERALQELTIHRFAGRRRDERRAEEKPGARETEAES